MIELACASLCAEGFQDSGFARTFSMIPEAGYRFVEFNLWHGTSLMPEMVESLRARCASTGLKTAAVYATSLGGRTDQDVAHKLYCLNVAEQLGCVRLVMSGAGKKSGMTLEQAIATLRLLAPVAEARGMLLSLENHRDFTLERIEDYEQVFEAVPHANLGVCVDTGHFEAARVRLSDVVERLGPRINHIHVKDNRVFGEQSFCRFGEGTARNTEFVEAMIARGYEGYITVELSPEKDRPMTVEDMRTAYALFKQYRQA